MNILLIVVAAIFIIGAVIGYKKGLLKIIASLVATVITIAVVTALSPSVSRFLLDAFPIEKTVREKLDVASWEDVSKDGQISLIEEMKLPDNLRQLLLANNNEEIYENLGVKNFSDYMVKYIASLIANIASFVLLFIVVSIVVRLLIRALKVVDKLPLVGIVNHVAGGAAGLLNALIIVWIGFLFITMLYNTSTGKMCFDYIASSRILTKLYDSNILMEYLTKFMA